ncbi:MAG: hypothetical protein GXP38_16560, partial [Chloroflexi bacterium]|nr:hypothetical protein [Chloroflexota bacterium]
MKDVKVVGSNAYLANGNMDLAVVDVSDPAHPTLLNEFRTPGYANGVDIDGDLAFLASGQKGLRIINHNGLSEARATACDTAGHCTTATMPILAAQSQNSAAALRIAQSSPSVSFSGPPTLLDSTAPVSVTGRATGASLQTLTVTADGLPLTTHDWQVGVDENTWRADWTPGADGQHVLRAQVTQTDGSTASDVLTVTVDTQPPALTVAPQVYTQTPYQEPA